MQRYRTEFRAMACDNVIELYTASDALAKEAASAVVAEVQRIERKYSRYLADSVVTQINNAKHEQGRCVWSNIDRETAQLLDFANSCFAQSGGLFDITSGVLRRVWDFKAAVLPTEASLASVLPLIGWPHVERQPDAVRLTRPGMEIDFGGFGKEYAADRAAAVLLAHGIAHGFVDLGGDVVVTGPPANAEAWSLGIRHPRRINDLLESVAIASGAVATSGDYERYFEQDGHRYSHILNPRTGQSVEGLQSVTVFAPTCMVAGAVTTIAMLKGLTEGLRWLREVMAHGGQWLAVDADGVIHRGGVLWSSSPEPAC